MKDEGLEIFLKVFFDKKCPARKKGENTRVE